MITGHVHEHRAGDEADHDGRQHQIAGDARGQRDGPDHERRELSSSPAAGKECEGEETHEHPDPERDHQPDRSRKSPLESDPSRPEERPEDSQAGNRDDLIELAEPAMIVRFAAVEPVAWLRSIAGARGEDRAGRREDQRIAHEGRVGPGASIEEHQHGPHDADGDEGSERVERNLKRRASRKAVEHTHVELKADDQAEPPEGEVDQRDEIVEYFAAENPDGGMAGDEPEADERKARRNPLSHPQPRLEAPSRGVRCHPEERHQRDQAEHGLEEDRDGGGASTLLGAAVRTGSRHAARQQPQHRRPPLAHGRIVPCLESGRHPRARLCSASERATPRAPARW